MAKHSDRPVKTYAIGFDGGAAEAFYNELPYDRAVHTPLFAAYAGELRDVFADVAVGTAKSCSRSKRRRTRTRPRRFPKVWSSSSGRRRPKSSARS